MLERGRIKKQNEASKQCTPFLCCKVVPQLGITVHRSFPSPEPKGSREIFIDKVRVID